MTEQNEIQRQPEDPKEHYRNFLNQRVNRYRSLYRELGAVSESNNNFPDRIQRCFQDITDYLDGEIHRTLGQINDSYNI